MVRTDKLINLFETLFGFKPKKQKKQKTKNPKTQKPKNQKNQKTKKPKNQKTQKPKNQKTQKPKNQKKTNFFIKIQKNSSLCFFYIFGLIELIQP